MPLPSYIASGCVATVPTNQMYMAPNSAPVEGMFVRLKIVFSEPQPQVGGEGAVLSEVYVDGEIEKVAPSYCEFETLLQYPVGPIAMSLDTRSDVKATCTRDTLESDWVLDSLIVGAEEPEAKRQKMNGTVSVRDAKAAGYDAYYCGDFSGAVYHYSGALDSDDCTPTDRVHTYNNRAAAYIKLRNFTAALSDANACLALDPAHTKAVWSKGIAFEGLGRNVEARSMYARVTEMLPSYTAAAERVAYLDSQLIGDEL